MLLLLLVRDMLIVILTELSYFDRCSPDNLVEVVSSFDTVLRLSCIEDITNSHRKHLLESNYVLQLQTRALVF